MRSLYRQLLTCVVAMLAFFPLAVTAQTATTPPEHGNGTLMTVGYVVGMGILAGAGTLLAWWLLQKSKTSKTFAVLHQLWIVAQTVVAHVEAKIRPTIKLALEDGRLTKEERIQIQSEALAAFKEALGPKLLEQARKIFGDGTDTVLSGLLEWALKHFKSGATAPSSTPPTALPSPR